MATETTTKNEKAGTAGKADAAENVEEQDETGGAAESATPEKTDGTGTAGAEAIGTEAADAGSGEAEAGPEAADAEAGDEGRNAAAAAPRRSGIGAGAVAVVSAVLGFLSLNGTSLGEMLRERKQLLGQIESSAAQGGGGADPINSAYGAPWHVTSAVNGFVALVAVALGGLLLAAVAKRADTRPWVKAVALGGVILGALGLAVAGGMYFDILAPQPKIPGMS